MRSSEGNNYLIYSSDYIQIQQNNADIISKLLEPDSQEL